MILLACSAQWSDCGTGYVANRAAIAFLIWAVVSILVILKVFLGKDRT